MSEMSEVNSVDNVDYVDCPVKELTGEVLDYAVAIAEGQALLDPNNNEWEYCWCLLGDNSGDYYSPSTDWAQGGPIIEREQITLAINRVNDQWFAMGVTENGSGIGSGPTPLVAAMRCYVASKLGDSVKIHKELIEW